MVGLPITLDTALGETIQEATLREATLREATLQETTLREVILQEVILREVILQEAIPQGPVDHPLVHIIKEEEETEHKNGEPEQVVLLT